MVITTCDMPFKRKSQTQYSSWKSGTALATKRQRRGGRYYKKRRQTLSQRVARLARDLKPKTKFVTFYNNAGVDYKDTLGLFYNTTNIVYYISNYPLIAVAEGDEQYQRNGRKIQLQGVTIKYFIQQQLNCKVSSKVMWYIFQAKQYQATNYGTAPIITNQFLDQDCNGWISSESF